MKKISLLLVMFLLLPLVAFANDVPVAPETDKEAFAQMALLFEYVEGGSWMLVALVAVYLIMFFIKRIKFIWNKIGKKYGKILSAALGLVAGVLYLLAGHDGAINLQVVFQTILVFAFGAGSSFVHDLWDAANGMKKVEVE